MTTAASRKTKVQTRDRILDAAEDLFSQSGFHGVAIREIAQRGGVELGSVTYYFPSKEDILVAAVDRRAQALSEALFGSLQAARRRAAPRPPTIEAVIEAFITPPLDHLQSEDPGWRNYVRLLGQVMVVRASAPFLVSVMETYNPIIRDYVHAFHEALPSAEIRNIYWAFHFLHLTVSQVILDGSIFHLALSQVVRDGASFGADHSRHFDSSDLDSLKRYLVAFAAAGFYRLAPL